MKFTQEFEKAAGEYIDSKLEFNRVDSMYRDGEVGDSVYDLAKLNVAEKTRNFADVAFGFYTEEDWED